MVQYSFNEFSIWMQRRSHISNDWTYISYMIECVIWYDWIYKWYDMIEYTNDMIECAYDMIKHT